MSELNQEYLKSILDYCPETGIFTNKITRNSRAIAGNRAGCVNAQGYREIRINKKLYREHRLVWLYTYGIWPDDLIDHKNGVRDDNKICNLRQANNSQNKYNAGPSSSNTSGYKGVTRVGNKFRAYITINGSKKHLGYFSTAEEASEVYKEQAREIHKEFFKE